MSETEAEAVASLATESPELPRTIEIERGDGDRAQILTTGSDITVHDLRPFLDKYLPRPERRKGTAVLADLPSLVAHTKRFASEHSAIFCDATVPKIVAVLDYHEKGAHGAPAWGQHRAVYQFPLSEEWKKWTGRNGKPMGQGEFAQFIEDRITDISDPSQAPTAAQSFAPLLELLGTTFASPSKLLELSRGLAVRESARVKSAVNLATGEGTVHYETTLTGDDGAALRVPGAFLLAIPIFRNGAGYRLAARLRFRAKEGAVSWWYELHGVDAQFDKAIAEACKLVGDETGLPLYMGQPESPAV